MTGPTPTPGRSVPPPACPGRRSCPFAAARRARPSPCLRRGADGAQALIPPHDRSADDMTTAATRTQAGTARPWTSDTGERGMLIEEPFSLTYECARCHRYEDDSQPYSHWDGERWVRRHYCYECLDAVI